MRITIETGVTPHAIKIEGKYTIDELLKFLGNLYPDFSWKDLSVCDTLPNPGKKGDGLYPQIAAKWPPNPYAKIGDSILKTHINKAHKAFTKYEKPK